MGKKLRGLVLGQFLSLTLTGTAFASSLLVREGINAPTFQSFLNYFLLAAVYGSYMLFQKIPMKARWSVYWGLALLDVEASYFSVKAYQYSPITSVMLLDCWVIPCVLILTAIFLRTRYVPGHYLGVAMCIFGLIFVLLSDVHSGDRSGASNALLGDTLVFIGATLYSVCNVYEEFLTKKVDQTEILACLGVCGTVFTICQVFILERQELQSIHWTSNSILPFLMFSASQLAFSSVFLIVIQTYGSAMFNLSLLTSDMFAVAIRSLIYHESVDWIYFVAFAAVAVGLVIYSYSGEPPCELSGPLDSIRYERIELAAQSALSQCEVGLDKAVLNEQAETFRIEPASQWELTLVSDSSPNRVANFREDIQS